MSYQNPAFDKKEYWENRKNGLKPDGLPRAKLLSSKTNLAETGFSNEGKIVLKNRAYRRQKIKLPGESTYTKHVMGKIERKLFRKKGRK